MKNEPNLSVDADGNVTEKVRLPKNTKHSRIFFDIRAGSYWMEIAGNRYLPLGAASIKRQLQMAGMDTDYEGKNGLKNWERALSIAEIENYVEYAGPLAGYQAGAFKTDSGAPLLVTEGFRVPMPNAQVDCGWYEHFLDQLLGAEQMRFFCLWLKFSRESLINRSFRPGQFMVLCGPTMCGKSLLQNIITLALGGRVADPWRYMTEKTPFNADLCQSEHLAIEDKGCSFDIRTRLKFGMSIKDIAAVSSTSLHAKGRQAITLRLFKRGSFSLNDEAENVMVLPPIDDHLRDKIMLFRCGRASVDENKTLVWKQIQRELPGFLHYVDNQTCPKALANSRYGVKHFQHPDLMEMLEGFSPERRLNELVTEAIFDNDQRLQHWEGSADALERKLMETAFSFQVSNLLRFPTACGVYLARLRQSFPDRFESRKENGRTIWIIKRYEDKALLDL